MAEPRRIINVRAAQKARRFLGRIVALVRDAARGQVERGPRRIDRPQLFRDAIERLVPGRNQKSGLAAPPQYLRASPRPGMLRG